MSGIVEGWEGMGKAERDWGMSRIVVEGLWKAGRNYGRSRMFVE